MPSPADSSADPPADRVAVIACGALSKDIGAIVEGRDWPVDVYPLPPLLHNRPEQIAAAVDAAVEELAGRYDRVAIAYADCGTYGALDEVCARRGLQRLPGLHCYDLYAGPERLRELFEEQPGTYLLTDFLVRSFERSVLQELGLDRHPELRDAYFAHYTRIVWLASNPDEDLRRRADTAAKALCLPIVMVDVLHDRLESALSNILSAPAT